jgi:hypothetical protein
MRVMTDDPITVTPPTCVECGRPWTEQAERWRALLAFDDDDRFDPGETFVYCRTCDEKEFGES